MKAWPEAGSSVAYGSLFVFLSSGTPLVFQSPACRASAPIRAVHAKDFPSDHPVSRTVRYDVTSGLITMVADAPRTFLAIDSEGEVFIQGSVICHYLNYPLNVSSAKVSLEVEPQKIFVCLAPS